MFCGLIIWISFHQSQVFPRTKPARPSNGSRTDPKRTPNGSRTNLARTSRGPRTNPEWTSRGPRTDPERTPNDREWRFSGAKISETPFVLRKEKSIWAKKTKIGLSVTHIYQASNHSLLRQYFSQGHVRDTSHRWRFLRMLGLCSGCVWQLWRLLGIPGIVDTQLRCV